MGYNPNYQTEARICRRYAASLATKDVIRAPQRGQRPSYLV
jgi:hypothetical protein